MVIKGRDYIEVVLYFKLGFFWRDIEVEFDMMEIGSRKSCFGLLLCVVNV